ncbi:Putative ABC transporter ATP binding protein [hydrothermal vent metagenome]|uniref:ABC transporter ATP binding protein n=1 Tax=hydrothermal vent metagenome TaxID=652676 RepID=A0A3B1E5K8_9ZZZZ
MIKNKNIPLLEVRGISHNFDYPLFDNINLTLERKQSIAIIGVSGSGKSTLLNIFCSLLKPICGEVLYDGQNIFNISTKRLLGIRRKKFGIIFQAHYLFRGFSASENLNITKLLSNNEIDQELLVKLKIDHIMEQGIGELSGGQQQRLSIARVLTKKPNIIFADEPTGNLDKKTALEVMDILFEYTQIFDVGMLIVTHEDDIAYKCDHVYRLNKNELEKLK